VRALAKISDVVLENYKVGQLKKYGLDYDSLSADQPSDWSTARSPASARRGRGPTAPATISSSRGWAA
jgi:hypothetical protein